MKRHTFGLARVARVRSIERDAARGAWVAARADEAAVRDRVERLRASAAAEAGALGAATSAVDLRSAAFRAGLRAQAVTHAVGDLAVAAQTSHDASTALQGAQRRVDVLDRLESRSRAAWEVERRRHDAAVLDDLSTARAARRLMLGGGRP